MVVFSSQLHFTKERGVFHFLQLSINIMIRPKAYNFTTYFIGAKVELLEELRSEIPIKPA